MRVLSRIDVACALAKALNKPILYLSFGTSLNDDLDGILGAAPYLADQDLDQVLTDGQAFVVCDSMDECNRLYGLTVGDDGSTTNPYTGPTRIYALTIDALGEVITENS